MRRWIRSVLVASLLAGGVVPGAADDGSADAPEGAKPSTTVYATATVRERAVDDATTAVSVEGAEAIEARGALGIVEMLTFVPGLSPASSGTRGGLETMQIRGGDPNFTRVLVDGVPLNDGTYQVGGVFDFSALPADGVERLEVVRGPLSAYYGSTGLAGAIQVITRRGEGAANGSLKLTGGDADLRRGALSLGAGGERTDGFFSAVLEEEKGRIADESFDLAHLLGRTSLRFADRGELALSARLADWQSEDYPDASGGPVLGSGELRGSDHQETGLGLRLSWLGSAQRSQRADLAIYRHQLDRDSPAVFPLVPESFESTRFTRGRVGWSASRTGPGSSARSSLEVSFGGDVEWEDGVNDSVLFLPPFLGGEIAGDYSLRRTTPGIFGEMLLRRDRFSLELDLRADFPDNGDAGSSEELSPRMGLAWSLNESTRLRASVGRAFKLPSFFALASPPALGGNPALQPETVVGGDLGIEHSVPGRGLQVAVTAFANRFEDLVDFDFDTFTHVNRSRVEAHGIELALTWTPSSSVSAAANATWQQVEDQATGLALLHRPDWSGGLRFDWRPNGRLQLGADLRFASASRDQQIPVPERDTVAGHELLGLVAAVDLDLAWKLTLRLDNVTDQDYETLVGFPGPGRSGRLSVAWSFGADD